MSFSTFIFLTGIKLFIRHLVVLFGFLILSQQFDGFVQLHPWCILKDNTEWNNEFYIPLLLRQNKSRYKIWHWLELGWFCKWKQSSNKEIQHVEWFWCRYGFILTLSIFISILLILRLARMSQCKSDTPTFVDKKG